MPASFWPRRKANRTQTDAPEKQQALELITIDDSPKGLCDFMPQPPHSLMVFSPVSRPERREMYGDHTGLTTPSSEGIEKSLGDMTTDSDREWRDETFPGSDADIRSPTSSPIRDTPVTPEFIYAATNTGQKSSLTKAAEWLQEQVFNTRFRFDLFTVKLYILLGFVVAVVFAQRALSAFGLLVAACVSALKSVSNIIEMVLELSGFVVGRAVAKIGQGFVRGYQMD
ncbi:hypothetical protein K504DRAFT_450426 [Pleomassaria siparia CBS 279.74]|uniref:Uncharacterized protein n=1 Tax=Pleomassaria siparia CBS 279.74 TaxID=1314801 RepID=A0A6G1KLV0_9PLEO|nr:hypothetical protein K504DRAFT_450426 [Pleomassaria siparia CBS 279.74]